MHIGANVVQNVFCHLSPLGLRFHSFFFSHFSFAQYLPVPVPIVHRLHKTWEFCPKFLESCPKTSKSCRYFCSSFMEPPCKDPDQSPVSQNSGFGILCNILRNLTNGMPDKIWHHSYVASHWSYFPRFCILSST